MRRNKKMILILILVLGIGFATITTALYLNGSILIAKNESEFKVKFTQAILGDTDISDTAIKDEGASIIYSTGRMEQVNEKSNLKVKIKNESTLYDADVTIECTEINHTDYAELSATIGGDTRKTIKAGHTAEGLISVRIKSTTLEDINEEFTCTISATAKERNVSLEDEPETFVKAYSYNESYESGEYCVRGDEETCVPTDCYKTKEAGSCPAGTIIKYMVNEDTEKTFHVMYDDVSTITMQSQKNIVNSIPWMSMDDYIAVGGSSTEYTSDGNNNKGPLSVLNAVEASTANWENVNNQAYKLGETEFGGSAFNGCSTYNNCSSNIYSFAPRSGKKARIISVQEAANLGCTESTKTCPIWMYNYLKDSIGNGGNANDNTDYAYWTLSAYTSDRNSVWYIYENGNVTYSRSHTNFFVGGDWCGARAVVIVNKE